MLLDYYDIHARINSCASLYSMMVVVLLQSCTSSNFTVQRVPHTTTVIQQEPAERAFTFSIVRVDGQCRHATITSWPVRTVGVATLTQNQQGQNRLVVRLPYEMLSGDCVSENANDESRFRCTRQLVDATAEVTHRLTLTQSGFTGQMQVVYTSMIDQCIVTYRTEAIRSAS